MELPEYVPELHYSRISNERVNAVVLESITSDALYYRGKTTDEYVYLGLYFVAKKESRKKNENCFYGYSGFCCSLS